MPNSLMFDIVVIYNVFIIIIISDRWKDDVANVKLGYVHKLHKMHTQDWAYVCTTRQNP